MIQIKKQKVEGDQPLHCHLWCLCVYWSEPIIQKTLYGSKLSSFLYFSSTKISLFSCSLSLFEANYQLAGRLHHLRCPPYQLRLPRLLLQIIQAGFKAFSCNLQGGCHLLAKFGFLLPSYFFSFFSVYMCHLFHGHQRLPWVYSNCTVAGVIFLQLFFVSPSFLGRLLIKYKIQNTFIFIFVTFFSWASINLPSSTALSSPSRPLIMKNLQFSNQHHFKRKWSLLDINWLADSAKLNTHTHLQAGEYPRLRTARPRSNTARLRLHAPTIQWTWSTYFFHHKVESKNRISKKIRKGLITPLHVCWFSKDSVN